MTPDGDSLKHIYDNWCRHKPHRPSQNGLPEVVSKVTPRPSTNVPPCADELLHELGSEELFQRVLAIGYMNWQGFEKNRRKCLGEKYKPKYHSRGGCEIRHLYLKVDGSQTRCSHQQGGHTMQQDAESRKERGNRGQNSYRIMCSFTRGTKYSTTIHL